ncbi:MAG: TRAP transporter small permease [Pseudomonadota bacterium]|nr:TRAP transporter small permease [Pseudomonadota bacterium]
MGQNIKVLKEILWPSIFILSLTLTIAVFPNFIITLGWASDDFLSIHEGKIGLVNLIVVLIGVVALVLGTLTVSHSENEIAPENIFDKFALFIGRVTMLLVVSLVTAMFAEVVLRYVFEAPTLWANELCLWMSGFVFLLSGLYAMQQRNHIRIYLLYDILPRNIQRLCDTVSVLLILFFAFSMVYGGFGEAQAKFLRWETFGTAWDPPLPATIKPTILIAIILVAVQSLVNLIADWNKVPQSHSPIDETEVESIVQQNQRES